MNVGVALDRLFDWKWLPALALALIAALFLFVNRASYSGSYFDGPGLVRLEEFSHHTVADHLLATIKPDPGPDLDAPLGRLVFGLLAKVWRGTATPYVIVSQALHIVNIVLLLLLALRMGIGTRVAALAIGVFGFCAGVSDAFWRPGHFTEPLCGCLALLCLLLWLWKKPVLSTIAYWLALQIDLTALLLPLGLLIYVLLVERNRLPQLAPHGVLMAYGLLQFVLQANLSFRPAEIWHNFEFHVDELMQITWGRPVVRGLILIVGLVLAKKLHRFTYGLFWALLLPLLFLGGRPADHSIYVPLIGVALFLASVADELGEDAEGIFATVVVGLWLAFNVPAFNDDMAYDLKQAALARQYTEKVLTYDRWPADGNGVVLDGAPPWFGVDGVRAFLRLSGMTIPIEPVSSPDGRRMLQVDPALTMLDWSSERSVLITKRQPGLQGDYELAMDTGFAALQLGPGWYDRDKGTRWMEPRASVSLRRPTWADRLVLEVSIPKEQIAALQAIHFGISRAGKELFDITLKTPGVRIVTWELGDQIPVEELVRFDLAATPEWTLNGFKVGLNVRSFGYRSSK